MVTSVTVGFYCTLLTSVLAEVIINNEESVFSLSPSADIIAFSNYTTNNPLDNLKDFPETFDVHEFNLNSENETELHREAIPDQLAVETLHLPKDHNHNQTNPTSNSSQPEVEARSSLPKPHPTVQTVTLPNHPVHPITLPQSQPPVSSVASPEPTTTVHTHDAVEEETTATSGVSHVVDTDAFSSLYEGLGSEWSDNITDAAVKEETNTEEDNKEVFDSELYEVVTAEKGLELEQSKEEHVEEVEEDEEDRYQTLLNELRKKYGDGSSQDEVRQLEVVLEHNVYHENHDGSVHHEEQDHKEHLEHHDDGQGHSHIYDPSHGYPADHGHDHGHGDHAHHGHHHVKNPLVRLIKVEPHALELLMKPRQFYKGTMVRLMYERVPRNRPPMQQHLDDPVIEYVPLYWPAQHYRLKDLPMGKYIVCGEAHNSGKIMQANCFETVIDRLDTNMLQGGVVGVICVAIISIFLVIVYAIYYRLTRKSRQGEKDGHHESG